MEETWIVQREGIEACATTDQPQLWTADYRIGAFQGLFFDENGVVMISKWSAEWAPRIVALLPNASEVIMDVAEKLWEEDRPHGVREPEDVEEIWNCLIDSGDRHLSLSREKGPSKWAWDYLTARFASDTDPQPPF